MNRRFLPTAATLLLLGACAMPPPAPNAQLPFDALVGAGDPVRSAVASTSFAFSHQGQLAGQPADAARALAQMEYLAVELPNNPRFVGGPAICRRRCCRHGRNGARRSASRPACRRSR
ncbi:hypothetical protein ACFQU2_04710 [Siccirubricoccus deserti]